MKECTYKLIYRTVSFHKYFRCVCTHGIFQMQRPLFTNRLGDWQVMFLGVAKVCFCSFPEELIDFLVVFCADQSCMIVTRMNCQAAENAHGCVSADL